jgi:hypothetical protein
MSGSKLDSSMLAIAKLPSLTPLPSLPTFEPMPHFSIDRKIGDYS